MTASARKTHLQRIAVGVLRLLSLLAIASFLTVLLVRCAPGYFSRAGEMDAEHSASAKQRVEAQQEQEGSAVQAWSHFADGLLHGELGTSQQYGEPVRGLLWPRIRTTARVVLPAVLLAPALALLLAVPCSQLRRPALERTVAALTLLGIAVPVSVLASAIVLSGLGGPALVLLLVVAARDFRFFTRLLRRQGRAQYGLYARAWGAPPLRLLGFAVLLPVRRELLSLFALSFITALGSMVPVEVIFGVPGIGQMAWNAAMNRDLPVLLAVTLLVALLISVASHLAQGASLRQGGEVAA